MRFHKLWKTGCAWMLAGLLPLLASCAPGEDVPSASASSSSRETAASATAAATQPAPPSASAPAAVGLPRYDSRPHNRSLTVEKADCRDQPGLHSLPTETASSAALSREERAAERLRTMTLEEKAGQVFFVRCNKASALSDIARYKVGGLILFASNAKGETKASLSATLADYQKASDIPLLIGTDEEGGTVNRLSLYKAFRAVPFHSPQELMQEGGLALVSSDATEKAQLLKSLGPQRQSRAGLRRIHRSGGLYLSRTLGKPAAETADYVRAVVQATKAQGVGSVLKHFPGYGNNADTHTGIATDTRPFESFEQSDFLPFEAGIAAGAGGILVSHNIVTCMDEDLPASLSPAVHAVLRDRLGFDGVVMTDDLAMDAIRDYTGSEQAAVLALNAGNRSAHRHRFRRADPGGDRRGQKRRHTVRPAGRSRHAGAALEDGSGPHRMTAKVQTCTGKREAVQDAPPPFYSPVPSDISGFFS